MQVINNATKEKVDQMEIEINKLAKKVIYQRYGYNFNANALFIITQLIRKRISSIFVSNSNSSTKSAVGILDWGL